MSIEKLLLNDEEYKIIFSIDKESETPCYMVNTKDKVLIIYNTSDEYTVNTIIDKFVRQYKR